MLSFCRQHIKKYNITSNWLPSGEKIGESLCTCSDICFPSPTKSKDQIRVSSFCPPSTHLSIHPFIQLPTHSSSYPPIYSPMYPSIFPSTTHPPIHPSFHPLIHPFIQEILLSIFHVQGTVLGPGIKVHIIVNRSF